MDCVLRIFTLILQAGFLVAENKISHVQGVAGSEIFLSPHIPHGFTIRDVFWRHSNEIVASHIQGTTQTIYQSRFFERARLLNNFTLEISGLEIGDSGIFTSLLVDIRGHMKQNEFHLTVYEPVAQPAVQVFASSSEEDGKNCTVVLICTTTNGSNATYTWRADSMEQDRVISNEVTFDGGHILKVILAPTDQDTLYTCTVNNPVSQLNTSVMPWNSCKFHSGADAEVFSCKMIPYLAATLILLFIAMTFWVLLCTRTKGKSRQKEKQNVEGVLLQHTPDRPNQDAAEDGPQNV
ncbi:SLAM family member 8 [Xenopus laevis]|uniref:SLAM family member 8 n=1 Tax=Xenopus laevis TaxID=8355 RepID=A0A8J0TT48_XENLA|nr:SLAM family member 8 [Xenopus laevis]